MKPERVITALAVLLVLRSFSLAQTAADSIPEATTPSIVAARCQYSPADDDCTSVTKSDATASSENTDNNTLAQIPRRVPGPPHPIRRRPVGHPGPAYAPMPMPPPSRRKVAIGALVGFSVGAIAPQNVTARARVGLGLIGAAFGALIGAAIPSAPSYHWRHRRWPDDDDDELASRQPTVKSPSSRTESTPVLASPSEVSASGVLPGAPLPEASPALESWQRP